MLRERLETKDESPRSRIRLHLQFQAVTNQSEVMEEASERLKSALLWTVLLVSSLLTNTSTCCGRLFLDTCDPHTEQQILFSFKESNRRVNMFKQRGINSILREHTHQGFSCISVFILTAGSTQSWSQEDYTDKPHLLFLNIMQLPPSKIAHSLKLQHEAWMNRPIDVKSRIFQQL